jgi:hypothetical protein
MWLFTAPPSGRLQRDHAMELAADWLLHLQRSAVRFNSGGSGAFVSAEGLVLTNHHVGADSLQKLGDETHNYLRDGYAAATRGDELKCPDLELNVLVSIEDVTHRVQQAVTPEMPPDRAFAARRAAMAAIERESLAATGLRSDVVTLYQGGAYHLYRAKKYTDVRLVFAPEQGIAFFGGDADNFEFPRFNLDVCFFRAYEDGTPARVPHHLAFATTPVAAGDLVFVSGHPGTTNRGRTIVELLSMRDRQIPFELQGLYRLESLAGAYSQKGPEERRQAMADLFGAANGRKARQGVLAGLLDPRVFAARRAAEDATRSWIEEHRDGRPSPYDRIADAQASLDRIAVRHRLLEGAAAFNSPFFSNARLLLRAAEEAAKPSGERLREYRDSNRESLELQLFSPKPLHDAYETAKLADSLTLMAVTLGADDELVTRVLAGKSPRDRAAELVRGTTLGRRQGPAPAGQAPPRDTRREVYAGGAAAVAAADDAMLAIARLVDAESRALRGVAEAAQEIKQQAHAEITRARFAREGAAMYPDATFTLRLAYGTVRGHDAADGTPVGPFTTFAGLFARAAAKRDAPPFEPPPRWQALRTELEADPVFMATPFNFASTVDIIGGNSGSPVVNRAGDLVGVIFDGNSESLVLDIAYDDVRARAVAVDAAGLLAALRKVYRADALVGELVAADGSSR